MYSASRYVALILAFCLGFSCCGGLLIGGAFVALANFRVRDIEKYGLADIPDELFMGDEPEVDLLDLSALEFIAELKELTAMGDGITINFLQKRYDLKIDEKVDVLLTDELRELPLKQLFSKDGITELLSSLYIGNILGYQCVDITTGAEADPELGEELTKWYNPKNDTDVSGIQSYLSYIAIGDFINGELDLNTLIDGIVIGDALGYTYDEANDIWLDSNGSRVTGVMAAFAGCKVTEVGSEINNIKIGTLLGYVYDEEAGYWKNNDTGEPIDGLMKVLADCTLSNVGSEIENAKLGDLLGYHYDEVDGRWEEDATGDVPVSGIMKVLAPCTMDTIGTEIENAKLGDLLGYHYDEVDGRWEEDATGNVPLTGIMKVLAPCTMDTVGSEIESATLGDLLGYHYDETLEKWLDDEDEVVTGFMSILADSTMDNVGQNIEDAQLGDLLGYQLIDGKWYQEDELGALEAVDGFMSAIADEKMDSLGNAFDNLTVGDIVGEDSRDGIFSILDPETPINDISGSINDSIMESPLQFFINEGLVEFDSATQSSLDTISALKGEYVSMSESDPDFEKYYEGNGEWNKVGDDYKIPTWRTKPLSESFGYIVSLLSTSIVDE